jgi:hypothetical protein
MFVSKPKVVPVGKEQHFLCAEVIAEDGQFVSFQAPDLRGLLCPDKSLVHIRNVNANPGDVPALVQNNPSFSSWTVNPVILHAYVAMLKIGVGRLYSGVEVHESGYGISKQSDGLQQYNGKGQNGRPANKSRR